MKKVSVFFLFLILFFLPLQAYGQEAWKRIGDNVNSAYFFVIDKIIALQDYFIGQALSIGRIVLLIAILSAGLNYALTGSGLKENVIKILKATVFFLIVIAAYPRIIGGITKWTFDMAKGSIYESVNSYFKGIIYDNYDKFDYSLGSRTYIQYTINKIIGEDNSEIFGDLLAEHKAVARKNPRVDLEYTAVAPAAVFKIIYFLAGDCLSYARDSDKKFQLIPDVLRVLVGLICAFIIIFTGVFALLEYLVCFLEFMLVSSVGVILFPLSIWEGSKFMTEKFIGAILGFFMKLLFCNIAIFLLIYGFISLFYFFSEAGFMGTVDQIIFILFICVMFLYICKSAPALAQSLLTGTPSLSASGAISAVGGAVAAAGATAGLAAGAAKAGGSFVGGAAKGGFKVASAVMAADAAADTVKAMGGNGFQQMGAFMHSMGADVKAGALGLTKNLLGSPKDLGEHYNERKSIGEERGRDFLDPSSGQQSADDKQKIK